MVNVSFIVPVYKVEKYLRECVDSILAQTLESFEVLLVDDGSPDKCPEICDDYAGKDNRVRVIHKVNGGVSSARNAGIGIARGKYVCFIDSDDFISEDYTKQLFDAAEKFNADIVQSGISYCSENGELKNEEKPNFPVGKALSHKQVCTLFDEMSSKCLMFFCWRNMFRRELLINNDIRFDEDLKIGEDSVFNEQALLLASTVTAIDSCAYFYRSREDSAMNKRYKKDYDENLNLQWKRKISLYEKYCDNPSELFYEDLAKYCIEALLPALLLNIYRNDVKDKYRQAKKVFTMEMYERSFSDFNINKIRSKSLDWIMFLMVKNKHWFAAHLICRLVLYNTHQTNLVCEA
jgi:glycosyltransferase EpsJ